MRAVTTATVRAEPRIEPALIGALRRTRMTPFSRHSAMFIAPANMPTKAMPKPMTLGPMVSTRACPSIPGRSPMLRARTRSSAGGKMNEKNRVTGSRRQVRASEAVSVL